MKSSRETDKNAVFRKISYVIITALTLSSLASCSRPQVKDKLPEEKEISDTIKVIAVNGDVHETEVDVIEESEAEDNSVTPLPSTSLAEVAQNLAISDDRNFAYSELGDSARTCYREIYAIISQQLSKVEISSLDPDEVDLAFRAVMVDHPEIFYVKGYSIIKYMSGKTLKNIAFSGTYTHTPEEVRAKKEKIDAYVDEVVSGAKQYSGDYDRIKYVYDYLIRNNKYVADSKDNQNILSVVENGETVCQGYTKMMQLILNRLGIFCTLVNGTACGSNGVPDSMDLLDDKNAKWGGHVWNIVKCNGLYYNVDVTWGDAAITLMNNDGTVSSDFDENYEFFLVDDESLVGNHAPEPVVKMPRCNSMDDNYYNHEGLYFLKADSAQLTRAFESAYANGAPVVFVKAASPDVYEELRQHLFEDQNIFGYLDRTNVRYVEFPERNLLVISL